MYFGFYLLSLTFFFNIFFIFNVKLYTKTRVYARLRTKVPKSSPKSNADSLPDGYLVIQVVGWSSIRLPSFAFPSLKALCI